MPAILGAAAQRSDTNMRGKFFQSGFTVLELMIVVIIIAIIAAFAVPNYQKTVERSYRRTAETNLIALHGTQQIYRTTNGTYWGTGNVSAINTNLGLNIIENGMTFTSTVGNAGAFSVNAVRWGPATTFTITVTQAAISVGTNPACTGTCP